MRFRSYGFCRLILLPALILVLLSCSQDPAEKRAKHMERGDDYFEKHEPRPIINLLRPI